MANNLPCSSNFESSVCDACQRAKSHQLPYNHLSRVLHTPLELIHTDIWGPALPSFGFLSLMVVLLMIRVTIVGYI